MTSHQSHVVIDRHLCWHHQRFQERSLSSSSSSFSKLFFSLVSSRTVGVEISVLISGFVGVVCDSGFSTTVVVLVISEGWATEVVSEYQVICTTPTSGMLDPFMSAYKILLSR